MRHWCLYETFLNFFGSIGFGTIRLGVSVMIGQTLFSKEGTVTTRAGVCGVAGATMIFTLGLKASGTFLTVAGMVRDVVGLVAFLTLDAKIGFS